MILALQVAGVLLVGILLLNLALPRRLAWREELARLSLANRQIFTSQCLFLMVILLLQAVLFLAMPEALLDGSPLARAVAGGLAVFWGLRLAAQFLLYDRTLWQGRRVETTVHWLCTAIWLHLTVVLTLAAAT